MKNLLFIGAVLGFAGLASAQTQTTPPTQTSAAKILFAETSHNFGTVIEGQIAKYEFTFTNTGTEPLLLTNVQASCGCTTPKWPREAIAPGASAAVIAEFNSTGKPGNFTKTITVTTNGGDVVLTIMGIVSKEPEKPKSPVIIKG